MVRFSRLRAVVSAIESGKTPFLDRHLLETEFGCSVSHLRVWHKIANSGLNGIIFEEDAIFESIDVSHVDEILKHHDSAWLG